MDSKKFGLTTLSANTLEINKIIIDATQNIDLRPSEQGEGICLKTLDCDGKPKYKTIVDKSCFIIPFDLPHGNI